MKYLIAICFLFVSLTVSAVAQSSETSIPKSEKKKVIHRAFSGSIKKQILLLNPTMFDDDTNKCDDVDMQISYRRPDLVDNSQLTKDQYVRLRLENSRRLALEIHKKIWEFGNS